MIAPDGETAAPVKKRKRVSRQQLTREIWSEAEQAVKAVARRRGWPHETYDDLYEAVRRLDAENPHPLQSFLTSFQACHLFRDNVQYDFMDLAEIRDFQPMAKRFVQRLEKL